ncbi:MAG: VCBS domain-containing protein [Pseudomonadota bacterium]
MANTTTSTTTPSFTKTPQATDDSYSYDEDDFSEDGIYHDGIVSLDVTSNDLGGAAKTLYSVSDGDGNPLTADFTLQSKDTLSNGASGWERTFKGNWMRINQGKIDYALGTSTDNGGPSLTPIRIDALNEGQVFSDSFVVSIRLGNGALSQANVAIEITGKNDLATITPDITNSDYVVTEAGGVANGTAGDPSASGQLKIVDLDAGQSAFQPVAVNSLVGNYGSFTFNSASGVWNYTLNNNNPVVEALNTDSAPLTDSLIVASLDGTASHTITVTINGTNDAPVIIGTASGTASEDTTLSATGILTSTDVDADATATWSIQGPSAGTYGSLVLDGNTGKWTYSLTNGTNGTTGATQSLAEGESRDETFTVRVTDDQEGFDDQTVTITVIGTNDRPTLTIADTTGVMNEDNGAVTLTDSGALSFADIDNGDVITASESYNNDFVFSGGILAPEMEAAFIAGFSVDHNSWDYSASENLDFLSAGQTISFSFNVVATDDSGTANAASAVQKVTITINGTNDAAVLSNAVVSLNETNAPLTTGGTLTNSDVDNDDTFVAQVNKIGTNGTFSITTAGEWTYTANSAFNSLNIGSSVSDTFSVAAADGTLTSVSVTINGTNDIPVISGEASGDRAVKEESDLSASGTLSIVDADAGQSEFAAGAGTTTYGNYTLGSNGVWSYTLDNANATVQGLAEGAQITDSFVAVSEDGTTNKAVMITITGTGEGPAVAPAVYNGADPNDNDNVDSTPASAAVNFSGTGNIQDTVHGSNFADTIIGNNGADTIYGNGGNDFLSGGDQGDSIYGGSGVDTISGGDQADRLYGGSGDDVITGNIQADDIFGGSGNDTINGNENNDIIIGGYGSDQLTGGTGVDTFRYLDVRDTGDTITDFSGISGAADKIDLSAIDANPGVVGNNAFAFGGETTILSANSVIWFVNNNGTAGNTADDFTVVQLDTDGDIGTAEIQINLTGVASLVAVDFIL